MYAELHCLSNFSFLRGASKPEELVGQAARLGYKAIAITDECSLAGVVKAHCAAEIHGIQLLIGSEFLLEEGMRLVFLAPSKKAYQQLSSLITLARSKSPKGEYALKLEQCVDRVDDCLVIWSLDSDERNSDWAGTLQKLFYSRLWLGVTLLREQDDARRYRSFYELACTHRIPMLACGAVLMHERERKPLQDVLTATRLKQPLAQLGTRLQGNAENYLRPLATLRQIYPAALLEETLQVAGRCFFKLPELRYQYPAEVIPPGYSATAFLRELTEAGAARRWPEQIPDKVRKLIEYELTVITELQYEHYFLTVYDIVQFARNRKILCQGRGSAANSAVCYCLYITEVDPAQSELLFERFISKERDEPPDIDVDFEHERREEVIQYIYKKYGRQRAALAATVITYRPRSAVRDVGKALGFSNDLVRSLSKSMAWWDKLGELESQLEQHAIRNPHTAALFIELVKSIQGFPRHLSQHVGGFIITRDNIANLVPVENATMADRTVIQWDKEDIEALGLLKIDVLALGMLSAIRKSLAYIGSYEGRKLGLDDIPKEDPATYQMLSAADSIGVFQVESRAQMSMLPRLRPQQFYDLVIQIAIIRPGPIQGGMVHPYLRRRQKLEPEHYDSEDLRKVLKRTLGVPIFQEQVIQLAMVAAGFSGGEADQLRRAMASWGKNGNLELFRGKLLKGMLDRGYSLDFAERLFSQMKGFGAYGFPESHSASFALLAYFSSWIKRHHPAAFFCGLLNSQPMGFYAPAQLLQDARRHGVEVLPICINHSDWDSSLPEPGQLRLGLRLVGGLAEACAERIVDGRRNKPYPSIDSLCRRVRLNRHERNCLVRADVFAGLGKHRYQSQWEIIGIEEQRPLLDAVDTEAGTETANDTESRPYEEDIALPGPSEVQDVVADYQHTGFSLRRHPLALLRQAGQLQRCRRAAELEQLRDGQFVRVAGLVTCRQRPGTASGVLFITLEDESGYSNIVVWKNVQQRDKQAILRGRILLVRGTVQRTEPDPSVDLKDQTPVIHVVAIGIEDHSPAMGVVAESHDFH